MVLKDWSDLNTWLVISACGGYAFDPKTDDPVTIEGCCQDVPAEPASVNDRSHGCRIVAITHKKWRTQAKAAGMIGAHACRAPCRSYLDQCSL
jgi:hypothetical protein